LVGLTSPNVEEDPVQLSMILDQEGTLTYFYMSFYSEQVLFDEKTEQTVIVSMNIDGYDATTVNKPADLASYEDMIAEDMGDGEHEGVGILSPEDVD
jgi:hypothetical protein